MSENAEQVPTRAQLVTAMEDEGFPAKADDLALASLPEAKAIASSVADFVEANGYDDDGPARLATDLRTWAADPNAS